MKRSLGRTAAFALLPMAGILSPLLVLPAVSSSFGATGWTAIAIGQSVGTAGAVFVELGWGLTGPQRVARVHPTQRSKLLAIAIATKLLVVLPICLISGVISFLLTPEYSRESALMAIAATVVGLNSNWFLIGTGAVAKIFRLDAAPRLLGAIISSLLMLGGSALWVYPVVAVILPSIYSFFCLIRLEGLSMESMRGYTIKRVLLVLRYQVKALSARALSALYIALPITLVGISNIDLVPAFAAIERLQRMTLQVLAAVPNVMQPWVGASTSENRSHRLRQAIMINGCIGFFGGVTFALMGPYAIDIIFAGIIEVPLFYTWISGVLILAVCVSRATGSLGLVLLKKINRIAISALFGGIIGIPAILIGALLWGVPGALAGELLAESVVLTYQLVFLLPIISARRR